MSIQGRGLKQQGDARQTERVEVSIPVRWSTTPETEYPGTLTNLGLRGCQVQTETEGPLAGQTIQVRLLLSTTNIIALRGVVLYRVPTGGFGLGFRGLEWAEEERLRELVQHYR